MPRLFGVTTHTQNLSQEAPHTTTEEKKKRKGGLFATKKKKGPGYGGETLRNSPNWKDYKEVLE